MTELAFNYYARHSVRALEALALRPTSAPQLASTLQIHPRTARKLLLRLMHDGWVEMCEGRRTRPTYYRTTDRLLVVALVHAAQRHGLVLMPLREAAELASWGDEPTGVVPRSPGVRGAAPAGP